MGMNNLPDNDKAESCHNPEEIAKRKSTPIHYPYKPPAIKMQKCWNAAKEKGKNTHRQQCQENHAT